MKSIDAAYNFNDLAGLNQIVRQSNENESQALKAVAKQFESMFVRMMLKSMRDANAVFEKDGLFDSNESRFYRDMFDDQLALSLSKNNGIGLAESIHRQLSEQFEIRGEKQELGETELKSLPARKHFNQTPASFIEKEGNIRDAANDKPEMKQDANDLNQTVIPEKISIVSSIERKTKSAEEIEVHMPGLSEQALANSKSSINAGQAVKQSTFKSPMEFVEHLWPIAKQIGEEMGVDPKAIISQAALETGWGKYVIHTPEGNNSFNLFGIKADQRWNGDSAHVSTLEYRDGLAKKEIAAFRVYESYQDSLKDYAQFITNSDRYDQAVKQGKSVKGYAEGLQSGGYATDPFYAKKIQRIAGGDVLNQAIQKSERG